MRSRVLDQATAGALDLLAAAVDALQAAGVEPVDADDPAHAGSEGGSVIMTDIVIDQATFERHLARLTGADPGPVDVALDPDPATDWYRCSALDGRPIDPTEAVAAALAGHVRPVGSWRRQRCQSLADRPPCTTGAQLVPGVGQRSRRGAGWHGAETGRRR